MLVSCKHCVKSFEKNQTQIKLSPNHFCSRSCSSSFNNKGKARNKPKERECKLCCETFFNTQTHTSKFCSTCLDTKIGPKEKTIGEYRNMLSVKGKHSSWLSANIRILNRSWNKHLLKPCQKCGYSIHVEFCHIKAVSSFDDSALLKDINSPENNIILCRNHHWEFDNGILFLEDLALPAGIEPA